MASGQLNLDVSTAAIRSIDTCIWSIQSEVVGLLVYMSHNSWDEREKPDIPVCRAPPNHHHHHSRRELLSFVRWHCYFQ